MNHIKSPYLDPPSTHEHGIMYHTIPIHTIPYHTVYFQTFICEFLWPFHLVTRVHQVYACACCNPFRIPSLPFTSLHFSIAVGKSHEQIALLLGVLSDCRFQHTTALDLNHTVDCRFRDVYTRNQRRSNQRRWYMTIMGTYPLVIQHGRRAQCVL